MNKKAVCFGGGNAIPKTILIPLKKYPVDITAITSMVDNGGSTGQLRTDFNVLPPGDIRRHVLALSEAPDWKKEFWQFRFGHEMFDGGHKGHSFSNAFIAGLEYNLKDFGKVLEVVNEFMEVKGNALPATIEQTQIYAELENGEIAKGEDEIDVPQKHDPNLKIRRAYLEPEVKAYQPSLDAVTEADIIIIGPGDLYSSTIP
ncbi:YvcK family protein, partial [Candidatus Parcubacteria bacterium]|nr:YvcK family protein [Candidatus Parcubacteria bacterium]